MLKLKYIQLAYYGSFREFDRIYCPMIGRFLAHQSMISVCTKHLDHNLGLMTHHCAISRWHIIWLGCVLFTNMSLEKWVDSCYFKSVGQAVDLYNAIRYTIRQPDYLKTVDQIRQMTNEIDRQILAVRQWRDQERQKIDKQCNDRSEAIRTSYKPMMDLWQDRDQQYRKQIRNMIKQSVKHIQ